MSSITKKYNNTAEEQSIQKSNNIANCFLPVKELLGSLSQILFYCTAVENNQTVWFLHNLKGKDRKH